MKKPVIVINDTYKYLSNEINNLPDTFDEEGKLIRGIRNVLKEFDWQNTKVCIKSFKRPTIANQLIYTCFRMGKAKRSYTYAKRLLEYGILTPEPIAYIEEYNRIGWLSKSYYICLYQPYLLRFDELNTSDIPKQEKKRIINQFVKYVTKHLHHNHILNKDFNGSNILINKNGNKYTFSLVDINRMRFNKKLSSIDEISNISNASSDPITQLRILRAYAKLNSLNENETAIKFMGINYASHKRYWRKKKTLKPLKKLWKTLVKK